VSAVLVIGGVDSSGGAGLSRDADTLARLGLETLCAVTAVTAQSDTQVIRIHCVPPEVVNAQIESALGTGRVAAIKIGMLGTQATVLVVARLLERAAVPVVLDPVLAASSGAALLDADGEAALRAVLLPHATLLTPNIPEAATLLAAPRARSEEQLLQQGRRLLALGPHAVLLKGGHADGPQALDLLLLPGEPPRRLAVPRRAVGRRGTGCVLSTAVAAGLADGLELAAACVRAKDVVTQYLQPRN
jgi:hydroxymethylpyrimidine/phosphomethylpyrimidine kinase